MKQIDVNSWTNFEMALQQLGHLCEQPKPGPHYIALNDPLLFRGVGNSEWGLETTLERSYPMERSDQAVTLLSYYRKILLSKPAVETVTGKKWKKIPNLPEFGDLINGSSEGTLNLALSNHRAIYEYLIYLRHHGFPSPFLDWTASPYVAALFAFDAMDKKAEHVAIYVVLQDIYTTPSFSSGEAFFVIGPYIQSHPRHYIQQSRYSLCVGLQLQDEWPGKDFLFLSHEQVLGRNVGRDLLLKLKIPSSERQLALRHLDSMNINPYSLYGSEEALIRTVARRECLFKSWGY